MRGFKSATLAKLNNSQNGTFEPVHEIWKFFWPKAFFWSIMKMAIRKNNGTLNWEQVFFWLSKNQYSQYEYICFAVQPDKKSYFASMVNHVPASRCHPCFDKQRWNVGCILPMYLLSTRYTFSTYLARSWKIKCTFWLKPKLYSQSTINIWRKLIRTAIWTDRNGLVSVSEACTSRKPKNFKQYCNLEFNPEILIQFRISFHLPHLESERKKPWFKPCS